MFVFVFGQTFLEHELCVNISRYDYHKQYLVTAYSVDTVGTIERSSLVERFELPLSSSTGLMRRRTGLETFFVVSTIKLLCCHAGCHEEGVLLKIF